MLEFNSTQSIIFARQRPYSAQFICVNFSASDVFDCFVKVYGMGTTMVNIGIGAQKVNIFLSEPTFSQHRVVAAHKNTHETPSLSID